MLDHIIYGMCTLERILKWMKGLLSDSMFYSSNPWPSGPLCLTFAHMQLENPIFVNNSNNKTTITLFDLIITDCYLGKTLPLF